MHFTPDGRFGFTPERDQDSVSKVDLAGHSIVKTISFPAGSRPWMLRVSPDGKEVWVQTGQANTNVVLDAETMNTLATLPAGKQPVEAAFQPQNGRYGIVTHYDDTFVLVVDRQTRRELTRIDVGAAQSNASFTRGGGTVFVSVTGADSVVAIDMSQLAIVGRLRVAGSQWAWSCWRVRHCDECRLAYPPARLTVTHSADR